jgi:hypothetical protein
MWLELAGDEALGQVGEVVGIVGREEGVVVAAEQRLVHVHAAAVHAVQRLGHEGGVHAVVSGHFFDDQPAGHDAVGHDQRLVVVRVDLVLRGSDLVVRGLHGDVETVERADGLLAQVVAQIGRQHVEVAALVDHFGGGAVTLEVEVLELGSDVELEPERAGAVELTAQHPARVALEGPVIAAEHVAEHEGGLLVVLRPGQDLERVPVGHGHDVGLLDLGVAGDGRAVKGGARLDHAVELAVGDLDHLEVAEDVGEPQLNVLDLLVGDELADAGLALIIHGRPFRPIAVDHLLLADDRRRGNSASTKASAARRRTDG